MLVQHAPSRHTIDSYCNHLLKQSRHTLGFYCSHLLDVAAGAFIWNVTIIFNKAKQKVWHQKGWRGKQQPDIMIGSLCTLLAAAL
jgi:hypothetical protein